MSKRFAILLDGGFVTKVLQFRNKSFPSSVDVEAECQRVIASPHLAGYDLLRIYFYDAPPATGVIKNPIDGSLLDLAKTKIFASHESLLVLCPVCNLFNVALSDEYDFYPRRARNANRPPAAIA